MEGKRGRGKLRIMLLDDIKTNKTHEMIKLWIEKVGEIGCLEPALEQSNNDYDDVDGCVRKKLGCVIDL